VANKEQQLLSAGQREILDMVDDDQGVGSPDHFLEHATSSMIHCAIHSLTHLLSLWGQRYKHITNSPNFATQK